MAIEKTIEFVGPKNSVKKRESLKAEIIFFWTNLEI
jgi:hypothetical protein